MPYIINSSPVKTGGSSYDRTIKTQADFDSFCSAITNGTMTDKRILFVGDGGSLTFTKEVGGILLPNTVYEVKGINNAKISIAEVESDSAFGIAYAGTISNENKCIVDGLYVEVMSNQLSVVGIKSFFNVNNCFVYSESYGAGASSTGFYGCKNLENCSTYVGSTGVAYDNCDKLVNCVAEEYEILYKNCTNVGALTDASNLTEENVASWQEKLNNMTTPTTELVNQTVSGQSVVVEEYLARDKRTWYRKWSNGFKECGGDFVTPDNGAVTVTLPLEFNSSDTLHIIVTLRSGNNNDAVPVVKLVTGSSTTNSFKAVGVFASGGTSGYGTMGGIYYASGY